MALVITLVMLALVTVMAVVFLAVARRERASVKLLQDMGVAQSLEGAALEQAKAKAIAQMTVEGSKLHYDLFNSTALTRPSYDETQPLNGLPNPQNVSYVDPRGRYLVGTEYLRMLANMQYDAPAPVFIETNRTGAGEFRLYLDFNRDRLFETNGILPVLDDKGSVIRDARKNIVTASFVGDPEWLGVLERPDLPHSETNRFIGRLAYLVLPAGKTLDMNYIHNQVDRTGGDDRIDTASARNGFSRNQGVGSWEINLAAFFRDLNTNNYAWPGVSYKYRPAAGQPSVGFAFDDARAILAYRYTGRRQFLQAASLTLGPNNFENPGNGNRFGGTTPDYIDDYGDGPVPRPGDPIFLPPGTTPVDDDQPNQPWPGSVNTNAFTDIQQLFHMDQFNPGLTNRLQAAMRTGKSSYDRYSFYRLAAQLGTDSSPAIKGKIHLNYQNPIGQITNTFVPWTNAAAFFTNAVDLMLQASIDGVVVVPTNKNNALQTAIIAQYGRVPGTYYKIGDTLVRTNFSITNIQVYAPIALSSLPTAVRTNFPFSVQSEYTPTIHRILQVAANIYDCMTNKTYGRISSYPYFPSVFQPAFGRSATNLYISGFIEVTNTTFLQGASTNDIAGLYYGLRPGARNVLTNVYGAHLVIGVKKGLPNFNEFSLQSEVQVTRKLELIKPAAGKPVSQTNQMFVVNINHRWGAEAWNSYTNKYPRNLGLKTDMESTIVLRDRTNGPIVYLLSTNVLRPQVTLPQGWAGANMLLGPTNFVVPLLHSVANIRDQAYTYTPPGSGRGVFSPTNFTRFSPLQPAPRFALYTTNRLRSYIVDSGHIIDYVSFDDLVSVMDLSTSLYTPQPGITTTNPDDMMWDAHTVGNPTDFLTVGVTNQIAASAGVFDDPSGRSGFIDNLWHNYQTVDQDKARSVALFRRFLGLSLRQSDVKALGEAHEPLQDPGDPRHETPFNPTRTMIQTVRWQANDPLVHYMARDLTHAPWEQDVPQPAPVRPTNSWNIGALNANFRPWGGTAGKADPLLDFNIGAKDAGIRHPDQWEFPIATNRANYFYPNIGALGQVHRGTPWQTLYLKSIYRFGTNGVPVELIHPTDWLRWAGSVGTYPSQDWKLLDVFTAAPSESATRGLLSVNQTNQAAWSAVLSGVMVATNTSKTASLKPVDPVAEYRAAVIDPASAQVGVIVRSLNFVRTNQWEVIPQPRAALQFSQPWTFGIRTNQLTGVRATVFEHVGDVLSAPHLSVQSPFLNGDTFGTNQTTLRRLQNEWTDRAVEYLPSQILSLLQRDEPRFVVYAFGQSLRPAPHSLSADPNFYHICTNYQITGEVISKATFRVEGDLPDPKNPLTLNNPLHAVVESYQVLPPPD